MIAAVVADGQKPGMSEYSRGDAEARRDSEAEDFFFSACSVPPREPALRCEAHGLAWFTRRRGDAELGRWLTMR